MRNAVRWRCSCRSAARNWDNGDIWVRDAFWVYALLVLGFTEEAAAVRRGWCAAAATKGSAAVGGPLKLHVPHRQRPATWPRRCSEHWDGSRGSSPVRIGHGAADQLQLAVYGEALDSIYFMDRPRLQAGHEGGSESATCWTGSPTNWAQPEEGIWETRGGRPDFTYGRLMNWVAVNRGARLATSATARPGTGADCAGGANCQMSTHFA